MKRILIVLIIGVICTACEKYNEPDFLCDCGKIEVSKKEYIAMCVVPMEVTANSTNYLRMENHTKKDLFYGNPFYLEYFNENNWEKIHLDINWTDVGHFLFAGETTENKMAFYSWIEEYNNEKKGKYRVIKDVSLGNMGENTYGYKLCAEFEIK
jgi:hypothetical protein